MQRPDTLQPDVTEPRPWLRWFCGLTIVATFLLIAIGGHVTSTDVGLAVPDGFTTFGYPTLIAPLEVWWYEFGTRWEHGHRLKGMVVGMMSIVMATWLFVVYADQRRVSETSARRGWLIGAVRYVFHGGRRPVLRWSGVVMLLLVISQGIMGALRVSEISLTFAFIHGIVGQLILCGWVVILTALSGPWLARLAGIGKGERERGKRTPRLRWAVRILLVLLLAQLTLGSAVRHFKADKAIPDFPLTYGQVLPPMSQAALDQAYADYYTEPAGISDEQAELSGGVANRTPHGDTVVPLHKVDLQFAHRLGAVVVCIVGLGVIIAGIRKAGERSIVVGPAMTLLMLLSTQFALGVITVLTKTDPIMATLHQATGAALIAVATWLAVRIHLAEYPAALPATQTAPQTTTTAPKPPRTTPAPA